MQPRDTTWDMMMDIEMIEHAVADMKQMCLVGSDVRVELSPKQAEKVARLLADMAWHIKEAQAVLEAYIGKPRQ